ncbi:MAG: tetratricopeptide repeat protein [bacterium]
MSRTLQLLLIVVAVVLSASMAQAQEIQGQVRYADSQRPAIGALVRCNGTGGLDQRLTDPNGKFYFRVSPGHYELTVRVPGYREESRSYDLIDNRQSEYADFRLRSDSPAKPITKPGTVEAAEANVPPKAREEFDKGAAAIALGKKENLEEGVLHLEKAVAIFPQFLRAQLMLGSTYIDLQQLDKAEQALKKTVEIDPKAANAFFALGEVYLRQKKNEDAEKVLLQGLQVEDRSYLGHLTLARTYVAMAAKIKDENENRPFRVKAYDQVNEALKYNAELAQAHWIKGNLLISVGRDADAQHEFEEYLRLDAKGPFSNQAKTMIEKIKKALEGQKP